MANVLALLTKLLDRLRAALPDAGRDAAAVTDSLVDEELRSLAEEILQSERKAYGPVTVSESEAWNTLADSLSEALKVDAAAGPNIARSTFSKRLKGLAANAQRRWTVILPISAELNPDIVVSGDLSTAQSIRAVVAPSDSPGEW